MDDAEIMALEFAHKYGVEIECVSMEEEKHPDYGHTYIVYTIKISRNGKSFIARFGKADLGLDEGEILSKRKLYLGLLSRIPKSMSSTYEEFLDETGCKESEVASHISQRWYLFEKEIYGHVCDMFDDVMDELAEIG